MKKLYLLLLIIIYFLTSGMRIFWLSQKEGLFVDEGWSVAFSFYNDYICSKNYNLEKTYTGKEIKNISFGTNDTTKTLAGDLISLWKNSRDQQQTNLYYSLLRISLWGANTGDVDKIIFRAGALNLLLFTISFFLFFFLLRFLFGNNLVPLVGCFCVFISPETISDTLFFRPYQLQETMLILFLFVIFYYLTLLKDNKETSLTFSFNLTTSICCSLLFLSGYFSIVFVILFVIFIVLSKQYSIVIRGNLNKIIILTIIITTLIYPRYLFFFKSYLTHINNNLKNSNIGHDSLLFLNYFITEIYDSIKMLFLILSRNFFSIPVFFCIFICIIYLRISKTKISYRKEPLWIFFISLISVIIIMYFAPFKIMRYVMPFFPFLVIFPIFFLQSIKNRNISYLLSILFCFVFLINSFNFHRIENVNKNRKKQYVFAYEKNVPVIILNKSYWKYGGLVPYLNDDQSYVFIDDFNSLCSIGQNDFYLLIEESAADKYDYKIIYKDFKFISYDNVPSFHCYKLEKLATKSMLKN